MDAYSRTLELLKNLKEFSGIIAKSDKIDCGLAVDGDAVNATTPIFGGNTLVTTTFTGEGPYLVAFRPKSFAAEASA